MKETEWHLDGTLLEALAAGAATEEERMYAEAHLAECSACSAEVSAMREENRGFAAELAREIPQPTRRRASRNRLLFMVLGAAAAAAILLLKLPAWLGGGGKDDGSGRGALAERREVPREDIGEEDGPRPPDPAPPLVAPPAPNPVTPNQPVKATSLPGPEDRTAGPQTYEGKSAEEWIKELLAPRGHRIEIGEMSLESGTGRELNTKAQHALTRLGAAAVPALLNSLKRPDLTAPQRNVLSEVLAKIEPPESQIDRTLGLLKDRDFEVRRSGVRMLAKHLNNPKVVEALRKIQKEDPDAAVIEAAEEALADFQKGAGAALLRAQQLVMAKNFDAAIAQLLEALRHDPNSADARRLLDETKKLKADEERKVQGLKRK